MFIHLGAMGSVPLSMDKPLECNDINITGTLNVMQAAHAARIKRFVYASSSAVYGDDALPTKVEHSLGRTLSPYAASKLINEVYARTYVAAYGLETVGLRFFNVFGPRQDPKGAYAAVIPGWISAMQNGESVFINGTGENTRDFCFVRDVVQALILASTTTNAEAFGQAFNVGLGTATNLIQLFDTIRTLVQEQTSKAVPDVVHRAAGAQATFCTPALTRLACKTCSASHPNTTSWRACASPWRQGFRDGTGHDTMKLMTAA